MPVQNARRVKIPTTIEASIIRAAVRGLMNKKIWPGDRPHSSSNCLDLSQARNRL